MWNMLGEICRHDCRSCSSKIDGGCRAKVSCEETVRVKEVARWPSRVC